MFTPVSRKVDFPGQEREVLEFWKKRQTFERSMEQRRGGKEYVFYDGPPFATGLPHYGHLLAGTIKDIVPRYQTMRGYYVSRRFGWDTHGLPVEYEVEQDLKISGKRDIEKLGVDVFNERCRSIVLRYTREWREIVTRMGRWVDFDNDYKTMDPDYMESIWWVFKALWDKQRIYEGYRVVPYCPRCTTPLSNFETNQGYEEVQDPAITVRFRVEGTDRTYILAWTTTPWTLPSNVALAVGEDIRYLKLKDGDDIFYLAKERVGIYYKKGADYEVMEELPGSALVGLYYEPLFPYFAGYRSKGAFRVVAADFVSTEDGTGVVHMAPGFGEDDSRVGQAEGLPAPCPVDEEGRFTAEVGDYAGREVKEADSDIIRRLKQEGKLVHQGVITHSYPHCWRCDTPLIYRAISAWYVRVEQFRDRLLAANRQTRWVPEHLREGRFGKWLEQARDWNISRNRYWGTPLPVWRSPDNKEVLCIGSREELERLSGSQVPDLHKHFVDAIEIPSSRDGGEPLRRIPEVLDCWFESGAMPYAQAHYPFRDREAFESRFPADFIAEGLDQTRGWFYTLMVLSTALFDRPAFRNVIVNGLVLAEDGQKMSKRLKNYPDPSYMIETYGADALRLYLINSPVVRAEDLRFSEAGVQELMRNLLIPLWNAYGFFVTYANVDGWIPGNGEAGRRDSSQGHVLDRWIRSSLESLAAGVTSAMDAYDLQASVRPFVRFIEDLTNWYIRRSRRRFWKSQNDADKRQAYDTLHYVLLQLSRIAAPFIPFISESIYQNLRTPEMPDSVHLSDFPVGDQSRRDQALEQQMAAVMTVVALGRNLRSAHDLKVRQPLGKLHVACRSKATREGLAALQEIILDELNVKEAEFTAHESAFATARAKANFARLGPRLGPLVKQAAGMIARLTSEQVESLADGEPMTISLQGQEFAITPEDLVIEHQPHEGSVVAAEGGIVVALDTALTPALTQEGLAREFVSKLQNMRKAADLEVTRRIRVRFTSDDEVRRAVASFQDYIKAETLTLELTADNVSGGGATDWDLNGHPCTIALEPV